MVILQGCVKTNYKACLFGDDVPDMPKAGKEVARELEIVCDDAKCLHLNNWINELYFFKQEYLIYKTYKANL
jgi:hypothetical protein